MSVSTAKASLVGRRVQKWRCLSKLGTGSFGIVHVWENEHTKEKLAIKQCRFGPEVQLSQKHRDQWCQEVDILLRLQHRNVVRCQPAPQELCHLDGVEDTLPLLCMEFCDGGDLRRLLNQPSNCVGLEQFEVMDCIGDLASALGFLHNRRIIHRDLKPENVVLSSGEDGRTTYKLIDLGYAKELGQSSLALSFVGTLQYIAPELFLSQEYTKSVDYWSLGFLCFEIITGQRPFLPNKSPGQWMEHVQRKSRDVICLYESDDGEEVIASKNLFKENYLSSSFAKDIAYWLRPLLEWDPKRRGRGQNTDEIVLFHELGEILAKRRISIIAMERSVVGMDYVVNGAVTVGEFKEWIERDLGIPSDNQLLLTGCGQDLSLKERLLLDYEDLSTVYVFSVKCADATLLLKGMSLNIPESIQPFLKNPRTEVTYPKRKQVYAHAHFFVRQEQKACDRLTSGLRVLGMYLMNSMKDTNRSSRSLDKSYECTMARYEFFRESLYHDLEKYRLQANKKDRITSNQMYESWVLSESELERQVREISNAMAMFLKMVKTLASSSAHVQGVMAEEPDMDLKDFVRKSLTLLENLRRIPVEGRKEKENLMDVAQMVVKCLKRRDAFLQAHFNQRIKLSDTVRAVSDLADMRDRVLGGLEMLTNSISRLQRRRQSDLWKLLAAAVQQKGVASSPVKTSSSPIANALVSVSSKETDRVLAQNLVLREQMNDLIKDCEQE